MKWIPPLWARVLWMFFWAAGTGLVMGRWWLDKSWGFTVVMSLLIGAIPVQALWRAERRRTRTDSPDQAPLKRW